MSTAGHPIRKEFETRALKTRPSAEANTVQEPQQKKDPGKDRTVGQREELEKRNQQVLSKG